MGSFVERITLKIKPYRQTRDARKADLDAHISELGSKVIYLEVERTRSRSDRESALAPHISDTVIERTRRTEGPEPCRTRYELRALPLQRAPLAAAIDRVIETDHAVHDSPVGSAGRTKG